ncbi:chemotaxis protein CheW [Selenomonas sp.]|uniref:chemotaxis protein CheW n=1 Tax=Selenomonas sp. TaxID=2053611 RepID=UPI0025E00162|nr:chemotaxis protein CheW [Selenomonas sp.]MCI6084915.1 chemotaxis protein CheW [Selenomonas sp.]MDY3296945.1 chemotaxis protein CheW [Selenomonas sp.]MDY4416941.1 chemotaxis protein CheW [Selenomonas sp.]
MDEELQAEEDTQRDKYLTFTLEDELYGIDIKVVIEIIGILPITAVPEVPEYVKGIINLRGKIIPVVDMRLRFHRAPRVYTDRTCVIVIEADGVLVGLIIDGVSEVRDIPEAQVVPPPKLKAAQNRYIKGVGRLDEGSKVVLLLDWEKLFSKEENELFESMADEDEAPQGTENGGTDK